MKSRFGDKFVLGGTLGRTSNATSSYRQIFTKTVVQGTLLASECPEHIVRWELPILSTVMSGKAIVYSTLLSVLTHSRQLPAANRMDWLWLSQDLPCPNLGRSSVQQILATAKSVGVS